MTKIQNKLCGLIHMGLHEILNFNDAHVKEKDANESCLCGFYIIKNR